MVAPGDSSGSLHGNADWFQHTVTLAQRYEIAHELLGGSEARDRFPLFEFDDDCRAYFEPGGGFVRPESAVRAQLQLAAQHGASLRLNERVTRINITDSSVQVHTTSGTYHAEQVVVSVGAWIHEFLQAPQIQSQFSIYRQVLHWFDIAPHHASLTSPDTCPVYMWAFGPSPEDFFYGFPAIEGPDGGMKIATEQFTTSTSIANVDRSTHPQEAQHAYEHCLRGRHNGITSTPLRSSACLYTVTDDSHFIIDAHPELDGVHLVSPCSGHGFKHSAALGEAMAQKIMDGRSTIDLSSFALP
jgi:sarcosine oxidase